MQSAKRISHRDSFQQGISRKESVESIDKRKTYTHSVQDITFDEAPQEQILSGTQTIEQRNRNMQDVIDNYYNSINKLEDDMRKKRDEVRLMNFETPQFDDGEKKRQRIEEREEELRRQEEIQQELLRESMLGDNESTILM